jgi:hypothetical protein
MVSKFLPPKKAAPGNRALDKFINAAPDAGAQVLVHDDGEEMTQITLRISKGDLAKVDAAAAERRIPRASFIRQAVFQFMK